MATHDPDPLSIFPLDHEGDMSLQCCRGLGALGRPGLGRCGVVTGKGKVATVGQAGIVGLLLSAWSAHHDPCLGRHGRTMK